MSGYHPRKSTSLRKHITVTFQTQILTPLRRCCWLEKRKNHLTRFIAIRNRSKRLHSLQKQLQPSNRKYILLNDECFCKLSLLLFFCLCFSNDRQLYFLTGSELWHVKGVPWRISHGFRNHHTVSNHKIPFSWLIVNGVKKKIYFQLYWPLFWQVLFLCRLVTRKKTLQEVRTFGV